MIFDLAAVAIGVAVLCHACALVGWLLDVIDWWRER